VAGKEKKNKRKQRIKNEQRNCKLELKKAYRILIGNIEKRREFMRITHV
jgi:hypothetical protein